MVMRGTSQHLIAWSQTQVDGKVADPKDRLEVGSLWRWIGYPMSISGNQDSLALSHPQGWRWMKRKASNAAAKMRNRSTPQKRITAYLDDPLLEGSFIVSDGMARFCVIPIDLPHQREPLLLFPDGLPPVRKTLSIVEVNMAPHPTQALDKGVLCFTPGTLIRTPNGQSPVEDLFPGDKVLTKDSGPQEILWMGMRQVSGARLHMTPSLKPVRIRAGALGEEEPQPDLVVSADHRVLLQGRKAEALFNTPEVLVRAADLVDDYSILTERSTRHVAYVHMLLPRHEVIWANGVETESFHPGAADLDHLNDIERRELSEAVPDVDQGADIYGPYARRCLTLAEAAILRTAHPPKHLS